MVSRESEPDLATLSEASETLHSNHPSAKNWRGSPFGWLLPLPSATRGAIARDLVEDWALSFGASCSRLNTHHKHYLVINNRRLQVKLSTLWDKGFYKFQQIRDQDYDFLLCLGLSPQEVHAWLIPKEEVMIRLAGVAGQHTGAAAQETMWLTVTPGSAQTWLDEFGGQLAEVRQMIEAF